MTNRFEVEIDTALAAALNVLDRATQRQRFAADEVRRSARQTRDRSGRWSDTFASALVAVAEYSITRTVNEYNEAVAATATAQAAVDALDAQYTGWSRFFLVTNTNGHVHSSMSCSTCFNTTTFAWLPTLSGLDEAAAVADQGEILCSVCFPSAPVAWTTGVAKATQVARGERAAKSAALAAKKAEKALYGHDSDAFVRLSNRDRISTIAAAKMYLTDEAQYLAWGYQSRVLADIDLVLVALSERLGTTAAAEWANAQARAAKRK